MDQDEFIKKSDSKHGSKYDYSSVIFISGKSKVKIICPKHGIFEQTPYKHLSGQGCERCARELFHYNQDTTESFIKKAKRAHGSRYDYSLVEYKQSWIKVKIICPKHGIFEQTPNNHIMGMKCIKCSIEENALKRKSNTKEFIRKAKKVHGRKYDYSQAEYVGCNAKVKIVCPLHGLFSQLPSAHLNNRGCPACHESRGERKIVVLLESYGINFQRQKIFDHCKNDRNLPFDFFLPDYNTCIEYDGKQHFVPVDFFGGVSTFEQLKKLDALKNDFCQKNGIRLIRISYKQRYSEVKNTLKMSLKLPDTPHKQVLYVPVKETIWDKVREHTSAVGYITNRDIRAITGFDFSKVSRLLLRWVEYGRLLKIEGISRKATRYCLSV